MRALFFLCFSLLYLFAEAHIFVYHRFDDPRYKSADTTTSELIKQFEHFKNNGYTVVPVEDMIAKLQSNEEIPDKWVALTIDDAYKSFYDHGLEVFKRYGYPFSLFVYVEATNKKYGDYMTWDQIKEASEFGTIGLHSYAHPRLQNLTTDQVIADTQKAWNIFEEKLGMAPTVYAYPYGEYNDNVVKVLKENFSFDAILNQNTGSVNAKTDRFDIPRIALVGEVNLEHKLRYTTFDMEWFEPKEFPKDGILKRIHAKVDPKYDTLKLYITGHGWQNVEVVDGIVDTKMNLYLQKARTRVMLGPDVFTISNKIINKVKKKENKNVK